MNKKRPRPTDGGGNWMDTYGDMVTLLLTFFVMLFAMSNLNQQKWELFVQSIYPHSEDEVQKEVAINTPIDSAHSEIEGVPDLPKTVAELDIDQLYLTLAERMNEIGIDGVTISRGKDYTFIVFKDRMFFDGDSSLLTGQGKNTLGVFCDVIAPMKEGLSQINIMAHTAQGDPTHPNNPRTDRMLSAMRAAEVCIFIQEKNVIEPEKLVNISYGQFRPIAGNETREGRTENRRVEILMIDAGADLRSLNEYYEEYNSGVNADKTVVTEGRPGADEAGFEIDEPNAEGVSTTVSPSMDNPERTSAEDGFYSESAAPPAEETTAE